MLAVALLATTPLLFVEENRAAEGNDGHALEFTAWAPVAMEAFVDNLWLMGVTFLCMIALMFLMKKAAPHKGPLRNPGVDWH